MDYEQREQALNPAQSFIIQAPAGSGKTALLIERYLTLLCHIEHPENILAITFTRKAAQEMHSRVMAALNQAETTLAKKVLARNAELGWQLLQQPHRLRIQTIDAFCAYLTQQLPLLAELGATPSLTEDPNPLYEKTIRGLLTQLIKKKDPHLKTLALHLDNHWHLLETLLINLLKKRDHWLPFLSFLKKPRELKKQLEKSLAHINYDALNTLDNALNNEEKKILCHLLQFSAEFAEPHSFIALWKNQTHFPQALLENKPHWIALTELLLTQSKPKTWRKQFTIKQGFPAPSQAKNKEEKAYYQQAKIQIKALQESLSQKPRILSLLLELSAAPPTVYQNNEWEVLLALFQLLLLSWEALQNTFKNTNQVDFAEIALRTLSALGNEEAPTDLALYLDHKIHHILIDEFQDTSFSQMQLLKKLTAGWQNDEGKSLFLVGDPMQSIYRFRNSEVGLFLQTQQDKHINNIDITPLYLKNNFRSSQTLIDWLNHHFTLILSESNQQANSVTYSPVVANRHDKESLIKESLDFQSLAAEAEHVVQTVRSLQQPNESIAILVQARYQLNDIIIALRKANIPFNDVELSTLDQFTTAQDLLSLTKALLYLDDRIAWLSILRAPWCGLLLDDLYLLSQNAKKETLWQRINHPEVFLALSEDAQRRLMRFKEVLTISLANKSRKNTAQWIKETWINLMGEHLLNDAHEKNISDTYFSLLRELENEANIDLTYLEEKLKRLYTQKPTETPCQLSLMTIHKAKGLEFDHVILPGLEKSMAAPDTQFMLWDEYNSIKDGPCFLIAPLIKSKEKKSIYDYLVTSEKLKNIEERKRLFYVAVTRAKKSLYLSAVNRKKSSNSFFSYLAKANPSLKPKEVIEDGTDEAQKKQENPARIKRLKSQHFNHPLTFLEKPEHEPSNNKKIDNIEQRKFGTVFHEILQYFSNEIKKNQFEQQAAVTWLSKNLEAQKRRWGLFLRQAFFTQNEITDLLGKISIALTNMLQDATGWRILSPKTYEQNEYAITGHYNGNIESVIFDRVFIEKETVWIIDYKTSEPQHEPLAAFLQSELAAYHEQLTKYQAIAKNHYQKPVRCGLYFPFVNAWVELP